MIKNTVAALVIVFLFSCSEKKNNSLDEDNYVELKYDTTAIDSFANGAMSVDVAEQIRTSSVVYQDSIREAKIAAEIARKELEEKQKTEALEKEKEAAEKKKAEGTEKEKEKNKEVKPAE